MPTLVKTAALLNVDVSCFKNYDTPQSPVDVNLLRWLKSDKYATVVESIRAEPDKARRDLLKATLPGITPSGTFTYRHHVNLIKHSGLLQFDIDRKGNEHLTNYDNLKPVISKLPIVAYCARSVSGQGYWGLVAVSCPSEHKGHFAHLVSVFKRVGITIDAAPSNVASLRGYTYDPDPYWPQTAEVLTDYAPPPVERPDWLPTPGLEGQRADVEASISALVARGGYLGESYNNWFAVGCDLAGSFGEGGRDYFHQVSKGHPKYTPEETDAKYNDCLKKRPEAKLGAFFNALKELGLKPEKKPRVWMQPRPTPAARPAPTPLAFVVTCAPPDSPGVQSLPLAHQAPAPFNLATDWEARTQAVAARLSALPLPCPPVRVKDGVITDVEKFVAGHLAFVRANVGNRTYMPYLERLETFAQTLRQ